MIGLGLLLTLGFAGLFALAFDFGDDLAGDDDDDPPVDPPSDDQFGTEGTDWLEGDEEDNRIFAQHGDDGISGGAGDDWLHGGHDHDYLALRRRGE